MMGFMCAAGSPWQCPLGGFALNPDITPMQPTEASRASRLEAALRAAFAPAVLQITDESARHAGHSGARPEGETHFSVLVVADAFRGMSRVARSRAVHAALSAELAGGLHALTLTLRTREELGNSE